MASAIKKASQTGSLSTISNVLLTAFIISSLYFGREILVPLALAALLTFMLAPLVSRFQRWMGRVGAVLFVVTIIFSLTLGAGWVLTRQAMDMAVTLPNYKENIRTKLRSVRIPDNGPFSRISNTLEELKKDLPGGSAAESPLVAGISNNPVQTPLAVEIVNGRDKQLEFVQFVIAPVLGPLGTGALVLLLLVFMLLERDDLRNRMIRLIGQGRIGATSRAMDDAGARVSKYLQMQLIVNSSYGLAVAIGLYFIGVPNALLWGTLAIVLRFIPYIGPWIAAAVPILLSLAISDGWLALALTISLYIVIELISNNVMEPWLYGSSTGVTPIALIVAALVWTWLWGPVGLVLATPLTVCLVVMGRHIPRLAFVSIALSDDESLTPAEDCYHRLHRVGEHEVMELVDSYLKSNPPGDLFDSMLVPVIIAAESDHRSGLLETEQLEFVEHGMLGILEELELRQESIAVQPVLNSDESSGICCVPVKAWRDELAGSMLAMQLKHQGYQVQTASTRMVTGELVAWVREQNANIVCVSAVFPTSVNQVRYLCLKLRAGFPDRKIIVGMWGAVGNTAGDLTMLRESGATEVFTSISGAALWVSDRASLSMEVEAEVA